MTAAYVFEELRLPLEMLACLLAFLVPFAPGKKDFLKRAPVSALLYVLSSLLYFPIFLEKDHPRFQFLTVFWYCALFLSASLFARACFVISRCDALCLTIAACLGQNILYCSYHCCAARILFPALRSHPVLYAAGALLLTALLALLLYRLFQAPLREAGGRILSDSPQTLRTLLVLFALIMICLFFYQGAFERRVSIFDTMAWMSGELVCVFLLIIFYSTVNGIVRVREKTALENMLRSSERCYEMSREHIAIINRKCHDLKHQLRALERAGEEDRAEYIREARESVDFYQTLVYTGNEALNTILAEKGLFCREKGILFRCSVDEADLSFIRLPDLYAILGNAIDNAIEYVQTLEDPAMRAISMRIEKKKGFIGIQVINPYAGAEIPAGDLPQTRKADAENHGFGMKSIRYLAEKYGGFMEFSTADGLFTLQILLPAGGRPEA